MASDELKAEVRQALFEGANPRGFSEDLKRAYEEILAEDEEKDDE